MSKDESAKNLIISADFGYGMTKAYNGKDYLGVQSLVGEAKQIKFNTSMTDDKTGRIDLNWISVEIDGEKRFIGELAARQSPIIYKIMDKDKVAYSETAYLMKSNIGLVAPTGSKISLITGLPVAYFDDENKKQFTKTLVGKHTVKYDWDRDGSYQHVKEFEIVDVKVIPQPMGTFFDFIITDKGKINSEAIKNPELACLINGSVAMIDVGYGTTDFCVVKNLEYIERSSGSLDKAMGTAFDLIANHLVQVSGTAVPSHIVTQQVIEKGSIGIQGKTYDLTEITQKSFRAIFDEILMSIKAAWRNEYQIDAYVLTGGGSLVLNEYFKQTLGDKGYVLVSKSPIFSNVIGYWKYKLMNNLSVKPKEESNV